MFDEYGTMSSNRALKIVNTSRSNQRVSVDRKLIKSTSSSPREETNPSKYLELHD